MKMNEDLFAQNITIQANDIITQKFQSKAKKLKEIIKSYTIKLEGENGLENLNKDFLMRISFLEGYVMNTVPMQA